MRFHEIILIRNRIYHLGMENFNESFLSWANKKVEEWARLYNLTEWPKVYVVDDELLDPKEYVAFFITPGVKHSGIYGPAIVFPKGYLEYLYDNAVKRGKLDVLWNYLEWTLAHEFSHYLRAINPQSAISQLIRGIPVTTPREVLKEAVRRMEIAASTRAFALTGKTRAIHNMEFYEITGETQLQYLRRRYGKERLRKEISTF